VKLVKEGDRKGEEGYPGDKKKFSLSGKKGISS